MTTSLSIRRWSGASVGFVLLTLAALGASAASPKRVLILNPFGHDVAPFSTAVSAFRATLARELGEPMDVYELPLELARMEEPEGEAPLVALLGNRVKNHPVDLVVLVGGAGAQFAVRHRELLFPHTPILLVGADSRFVPPDFLRTNVTLIAQKVNLVGMVEDLLQVQPQTTNIVVVFGASAFEKAWINECRREFQSFTNRVGFTWLNDLSLDQIVKRCAALPPRSFILQPLFVIDAAGVPSERDEALRRLHQAANAPIFAYPASALGLGSIGGRLFQDVEMGVQAARIAIRLLRGENPANIPHQALEVGTPAFDWRELRRWGISEARLPAGSVIRFRQPTFWEHYRWLVVGTALFCSLQAALIVGLLVNRSKRKQGEAEARLIADISSKFVNLPPGEVDRAILDAERRICELLGLEVSSLWQWSPEAAEVLGLTHLYRLVERPPAPEQMTAAESFPWCQQELQAGRIIALSSLVELPPEAARDRQTFDYFGIKSGLILPLSAGGGPPVGALSFGTVRAERHWPEALVKRLQVVAQIFTNALARKRADQALRESEERMTLAADSAQFGIWVWNITHNQVWGSERWRTLFGLIPGKDVSFEAVMERIHPNERETVEQEVRRALAKGSDYAGEFRAVLPDGTQRWVAARGRGYADANGTVTRMMGAAIDITERKRAEEALRGLSRRLIRAHEEERARLARDLHDDITQRLARLAIDAGQAERGPSEHSRAETMASLRDGLVSLSEDVHALSYRLHPSVLEDLGLAEALKAECERFSRQESVPTEVEVGLAPAVIQPEPALCLFRVTQEALRNVARHAKARSVKVSVRTLDEGLQLAVVDDGIGFEPALQRDRPSLGLASMRERVGLLGGELDIESAPGQGTTILVWLPLNGESR